MFCFEKELITFFSTAIFDMKKAVMVCYLKQGTSGFATSLFQKIITKLGPFISFLYDFSKYNILKIIIN